MKLIALLRIKDEINIIERQLKRLSDLVDGIIVVDNGSTDGTEKVYAQHSKVLELIRTEGFDEGRDKNMLLLAAKKHQPDWLIFLDADEIFEDGLLRQDLEGYMASRYGIINFRFCHFWLSEKRHRIGQKYFLYSLQPLRCMWRYTDGVYFKEVKIHSDGPWGIKGRSYFSPYRIKHYGFIDSDRIKKKLSLYRSMDGDVRDYSQTEPEIKTLTLPFIEFKNRQINYSYLLAYKYLCHFFWLWFIIYYRTKKLFNKKNQK